MGVIIFILRYGFLVLFYLFLFTLLSLMWQDFTREKNQAKERPVRGGGRENRGKAVALLVVKESEAPGLPPGATVKAGPSTLIGRGREAQIRVQDRFASHRHALLYWQDGCFWIKDLGSRNGTIVNGSPISEPVPLEKGDIIQIGGLIFNFAGWIYEMQ
ncbi:MAG: hypothetical protein PWQ91_707 [Eubacteriales bacterium]|nr:hypothetical protein [Eubacteriales bacterium]MDN5363646.1 hypothetical protein [Eubacteriales bacterium]